MDDEGDTLSKGGLYGFGDDDDDKKKKDEDEENPDEENGLNEFQGLDEEEAE